MRIFIILIFLSCATQLELFGEEWNTVYLASFPRSGNHWVRYLVEEATHIATSSVYRDKDFPHLPTLFPWGGYCTDHGYEGHCRYPTKDDPVLLKTHYPYLPKRIDPEPKYVICLIRHPIDALWSFNVYRGNQSTQIDEQTLKQLIQSWRRFYQYWLEKPQVLFIRYEDLQDDTEFQLSLILQKAGFSFNQADLERAVTKYSSQGERLKHINHYSAEAIEMIKTELDDILLKFNYGI